jgi:hypothetical protein
MSDKRQKNQLVLAFTEEGRSEAPNASQEGTESRTAKCETERPASHEQLTEEVCEHPAGSRQESAPIDECRSFSYTPTEAQGE